MVRSPSFLPRAVLAAPSGGARGRWGGFTLVETVMALGIAMLFLAGIFTVLSVGLATSKDASDDMVIGLILRETDGRIRGAAMAPAGAPRRFYFDNRGRFVDQETGDPSKNYFVATATVSALDAAPPDSDLAAVVVKVYPRVEPVKEAAVPATEPQTTFTLLKTTASGGGWKQLDPAYAPKIDL
jgi:uncharacterized protein (TIGR02598 family)